MTGLTVETAARLEASDVFEVTPGEEGVVAEWIAQSHKTSALSKIVIESTSATFILRLFHGERFPTGRRFDTASRRDMERLVRRLARILPDVALVWWQMVDDSMPNWPAHFHGEARKAIGDRGYPDHIGMVSVADVVEGYALGYGVAVSVALCGGGRMKYLFVPMEQHDIVELVEGLANYLKAAFHLPLPDDLSRGN